MLPPQSAPRWEIAMPSESPLDALLVAVDAISTNDPCYASRLWCDCNVHILAGAAAAVRAWLAQPTVLSDEELESAYRTGSGNFASDAQRVWAGLHAVERAVLAKLGGKP